MICYIMGILVVNLFRNKVLYYYRVIEIWLVFFDNLWVEVVFFFKGYRVLVLDFKS